jgi:hypothetical protein
MKKQRIDWGPHRSEDLYHMSYDHAETKEQIKEKSSPCPEIVMICVVQFRLVFDRFE